MFWSEWRDTEGSPCSLAKFFCGLFFSSSLLPLPHGFSSGFKYPSAVSRVITNSHLIKLNHGFLLQLHSLYPPLPMASGWVIFYKYIFPVPRLPIFDLVQLSNISLWLLWNDSILIANNENIIDILIISLYKHCSKCFPYILIILTISFWDRYY